MNWLRSIGTLEYILIGTFLLFYILYIIRIALIANKMKSEMSSVFYKFFLRSLYFFLLIAALLGPSFGNVKKEIKSISKEIYIVLDLSLSMNATDLQPDRLLVAKQEIKKIFKHFSQDKIGIIGFNANAFTLCPPTYDQEALQLFLESANTNLANSTGSEIASGLHLAIEQQSRFSKSGMNKIILLISDGEDFGESALKAAEDIRKKKLHLMILGVGSSEGSKIPYNGNYKRDKDGNFAVTKLNTELLKSLAEEADGYFYELSPNTNETELLITRMEEIEGTLSETKEVDASANKYLYFLSLALILIILDVLITVKTVQI